jgi:hypothetical protein
VRGQEFWRIASPSDAYHLPQILPQELQLLGRSSDDFGEVFLRVRESLRSSSMDRSCVFGGQSAWDHRSFCGPFRQNRSFSAGSNFCMADRPRLSFGQSAPSLADSLRQLGGQYGLYAVSCQACSIPLLLL